VPVHFQGKLQFAPAPSGAIAMKIGEFQKFDNNFFKESHYRNFININSLYLTATILGQFSWGNCVKFRHP
jgi:hypothetical protein